MKILYFGDIVGKKGLNFLVKILPSIKNKYKPNLVFVNGENVTNGKGLNFKDYKKLLSLNVSGITMGNHTFRNKEINEFIDNSKIARPLNLIGAKGNGYIDINYNGKIITVVNLIGSINVKMDMEITNPFVAIDEFINKHKFDYLIVDIHAEATSEKIALAHYLDGKALAVLGTHTHVQTNDARILPNGTMYITDIGMTGALDGVIGVKKEIIIDRFKDNGMLPFKLEEDGRSQINGVLLEAGIKSKIEIIHLED